MRAALRLLVVTLVAGLAVGVGSAGAAIVGPSFSTSPFTIAQAGVGNTVTVNLIWEATQFLPPTATDKQIVAYQDLAGGSPQTFSASSTQTSIPLLLQNGHRYTLTVAGCQTPACTIGAFDTVDTSQTTTIDATGPAGTVQVNGGAAFTNNRNVTLNVAATDPLIDNLPNTSSGVTQAAVNVNGNGSIPCDIIFGQNPDTSGCAQNFAPTLTAALPAGDGPKTVGVFFGDGARQNTRPCPTIFCAILLGNPILGNASAEATDAIGLDTAKPIALATQDRFTVNRGETVRFDASTSVNQNPATASGVDPGAATWQFKDGTPQATGAKVAHAFNQAGTFVGELRVRDRAGNVSDGAPVRGDRHRPRGRGHGHPQGHHRHRRVQPRPAQREGEVRAQPSPGLDHHGRLGGPGGRPAGGDPAHGARQGARPDRLEGPEGRRLHAHPQAAADAAARELPGLVRRPRRHPQHHADAQGAAGGRHPQRPRHRLRRHVPHGRAARQGAAGQAHHRVVQGQPQRHDRGGPVRRDDPRGHPPRGDHRRGPGQGGPEGRRHRRGVGDLALTGGVPRRVAGES